ncbi:MAG: Ig-like domain repeat protein, partial [Solirubrobacteraceae bacterium]
SVNTIGRSAVLIAALALFAAPSAVAAVPAWTTYDHDGARSGTDPDSGSPVTPKPAWSGPSHLVGDVYAQPLVFGSLVYVATENDTVYALDALTGSVVWQRSLGTPVPAGDLPCGDISPTVGITSTPVIDASSGRIYAVGDLLSSGAVTHELFALDAGTGAPVAGFPVPVDPPGQDPKAVLQRGSLALDGGRVIIPYGGNAGDCSTYHGWLVSVAETGAGPQTTFEVDSGAGESQGAIWGAGDGPSQDAAGHLFVETGNGNSTTPDFQESVVELDANAKVLDHWTAPNWKALDTGDADLGSMEPLPLPDGILFVAGKDGVGRLISATALGRTGQVFSAQVCTSGGAFGAALYRSGVIYVPCAGGPVALSLAANSASFVPLPGFSAPGGASGSPVFAGGLVWSTGWRSTHLLYGLDPATGAARFQQNLGAFDHFATPSAGGGRLFVAAGRDVYALTIAAFPPGTATALQSSANPARAGQAVTLTATVTPSPDAGTVAFGSAESALDGCGAVPIAPATSTATCRATLAGGTRVLQAAYGGDAFFGPSSSAPLTEVVKPAALVLSHVRLSHVRLSSRRATARRGVMLRVTVSGAARLRIQINRLLSGRKVRERCRVGPRHGARCSLHRPARMISWRAKRGASRHHLNLHRLVPGRYEAAITAFGSGGTRSRRVTIRFQIVRARH